jgi:hypothetical protein
MKIMNDSVLLGDDGNRIADSGRNQRMADEKTAQNIEARLSRIEGQIRGIRNMTAEGRLSVDIVTQVAAVRAALKKSLTWSWPTTSTSGSKK